MTDCLCSVSHEVRTPLNGIRCNLELSLKCAKDIKYAQETFLVPALNCAKVLESFMHGFVGLIQTKRNIKIKLNLSKINIRKTVLNIIEIMKTTF